MLDYLCGGLCGKCHVLNSVKLYFGETIFQLLSCITKLEVFENPCGEGCVRWHILATVKEHFGETMFHLTSHMAQYTNTQQTNTKHLWRIHCMHRVSNIGLKPRRSLHQKYRTLNSVKSTLGMPPFDYELIITKVGVFEKPAGPTRKVPHTQLCEATLWGNDLSSSIWLHWVPSA